MDQNSLVLKAQKLIDDLYDRHAVGCCFHIVTDDGNVEDRHVHLCTRIATDKNCSGCLELAHVLVLMTEESRAKALNMSWCRRCNDWTLYNPCGKCQQPTLSSKPTWG